MTSTPPSASGWDRDHLDDYDWRRIFTQEMGYRGATGQQIGDALAVVESHCRESGESTQQAFGDPTSYAASLQGPQRLARAFVVSVVPITAAGLAMALLVFLPWPGWSQSVDVTWGHLARLLAFAAFALGVTVAYARSHGRQPRQGAAFLVVMASWWLADAALRDWTAMAFTAPNWTLWLLAGACTLAATALLLRQERQRVRDPRGEDRWLQNWWRVAPWVFPTLAAASVALRWLAHTS